MTGKNELLLQWLAFLSSWPMS